MISSLLLLASLTAAPAITVTYGPASTPEHARIRESEMKRQAYEAFATLFNAVLVLPRPVAIELRECDDLAFFDRKLSRVVICYGYYDFVAGLVEPADLKGVMGFTLLHELAHAFVWTLKLPVVGREEDAADRFASAAVLTIDAPEATIIWAGAVRFFRALAQRGKPSFWDEHSTDRARFYDLLCQWRGAQPVSYAKHVTDRALPDERARGCGGEFRQAVDGWNALLKPYSNVKSGNTFSL